MSSEFGWSASAVSVAVQPKTKDTIAPMSMKATGIPIVMMRAMMMAPSTV